MKVPIWILVNKETFMLYLAFENALKSIFTGFKDLLICIVLFILLIPLVILEAFNWFVIQPLIKLKNERNKI